VVKQKSEVGVVGW